MWHDVYYNYFSLFRISRSWFRRLRNTMSAYKNPHSEKGTIICNNSVNSTDVITCIKTILMLAVAYTFPELIVINRAQEGTMTFERAQHRLLEEMALRKENEISSQLRAPLILSSQAERGRQRRCIFNIVVTSTKLFVVVHFHRKICVSSNIRFNRNANGKIRKQLSLRYTLSLHFRHEYLIKKSSQTIPITFLNTQKIFSNATNQWRKKNRR